MRDELTCDVVVVGSGAAGMVAALRCHDSNLKVLMIEKSERYGGTSAVSGAGIWIPNNPLMEGKDSPEAALRYLIACTEGQVPQKKLECYIERAPHMLKYLQTLGLEYYIHPALSYPDYYEDRPGSMTYGRSMLVRPLEDGSVLGEDFFRLRESYPEFKLFGKISTDLLEGGLLLARAPGWRRLLARLLWNYYADLSWRRRTSRDRRLTLGNALIAKLRYAMLQRSIPLLLKTRLRSLQLENGVVEGVVAERDGGSTVIRANRAVVLASGGFEQSQELRARFLDNPTDRSWSATPTDGNVGDGLLAATAVGAEIDFMKEAWWAPTITFPNRDGPNGSRNIALFWERGFPHSLAVNRAAKRFTNEICSYHQFGQAMLRDHARSGMNLPCWLIFDATFRRQYPLGALLPGSVMPDSRLPPGWFDSFLYRAESLADLAKRIGLPAETFMQTVERFNQGARRGVDEEFHRGESVYSQSFGDPSNRPNRVLGAVETAPFYAVRLDLGDLGTKGGPKTDEEARVLSRQGEVINGLYAVGNVTGSVMGPSYPAAGATLGAAMTFAYGIADAIKAESSARDRVSGSARLQEAAG